MSDTNLPSTGAGRSDDEFRDQMRTLMENAIPDDLQKRMKKHADDSVLSFAEGIEYWIQCELASSLSSYVIEAARRAIESMLDGNEDMMRRYLGCEKASYAFTGRGKDHPVIHGTLFEANCIELRRKLCDAHPELLKTERITDLEDQVRSLVEQVTKAEAECERLRERCRSYE